LLSITVSAWVLSVTESVVLEKFIHDENLKLYRKVLSETMDDEKQKQLIDLIRDEVAKETLSKKPEKF
jgi:hypothetical protein